MMTSAFFSTLSFSAEKICAQNRGAKRRDDIKSLIMTSPVLERLPEVSLSDGLWVQRICDGLLWVDDSRPGLLCALTFRYCWSPRGVVWFAMVRLRPLSRQAAPARILLRALRET